MDVASEDELGRGGGAVEFAAGLGPLDRIQGLLRAQLGAPSADRRDGLWPLPGLVSKPSQTARLPAPRPVLDPDGSGRGVDGLSLDPRGTSLVMARRAAGT